MKESKKKQKLCVIVVGPECSGTRLVTRLLIAAGCHGDATPEGKTVNKGWPQHYDAFDPEGETPIVVRRSLPYHPGRQWPDMPALIERFEGLGYEVRMVFTSRAADFVEASQLAKRFVGSTMQFNNEVKILNGILTDLVHIITKSLFVLYEDLVDGPREVMDELTDFCRLPKLKKLPEKIFDGNAKYRSKDDEKKS